VIHNELARARYDQAVGVLALRLVVMLAEKIGYTDNELLGHRFKVTEYAALIGLNERSGYLYEQFKEAADQLLKTLVTTSEGFGLKQTRFQVMPKAVYEKELGEIELHFHEEMRPLLLGLREYFSRIPLEVFFRIRSAYAARLYLMCKSWDPTDKRNRQPGWDWTVEELRAWLALDGPQAVRAHAAPARGDPGAGQTGTRPSGGPIVRLCGTQAGQDRHRLALYPRAERPFPGA
jgi:plasmid replication initiation protein